MHDPGCGEIRPYYQFQKAALILLTHNINYAIPPDRSAWIDRIEHGCIALEAACPFGRLMTARSAEKPDKLITNRQQYLQGRLKHSAWLFDLGNGRCGGINRLGFVDSHFASAGGRFNEISGIVYDFMITFQTETWAECERTFITVGDAVDAYSAMLCPDAAMKRLIYYERLVSGHLAFMVQQDDMHMRASAEAEMREGERLQADLAGIGRQLPRFNDHPLATRDNPAQPKQLGWINYWSAETCEYLGFPDLERDKDLLAHSYRTPAGAWLVKLCPEPLDLNHPDHLSIFADTYTRFPKLGIRAPEKKPNLPLSISYPQNTVFIHESDPWYIIDRLVPFLEKQGLRAVERLPKNAAEGTLTIGLIRGKDWTIVKTIPELYLAEKSANTGKPRLVEFCNAIGREGFMLNVYNQIEAILLETDGAGRTHVSGFRDREPQRTDGLEDLALENPSVAHFELLPIAVDMLDLEDCGQLAQQLYGELAGQNADLCDNKTFAAALGSKILQDRQGVKLHFVPIRP